MARKWIDETAVLNAVSATGASNAYPIADFQHIMITLSTDNSANATIKFVGSFQDTQPDFSAAASDTNRWTYVQVKDYQDNSSINGNTGVSYA